MQYARLVGIGYRTLVRGYASRRFVQLTLQLHRGTNKRKYVLPFLGLLGISFCTKEALLDLGDYCFFPEYKTKEDAYHFLKYYYRRKNVVQIEEAVKIVLQNFNQLSVLNEEQQQLEGIFKAHNEDIVEHWVTDFEQILTSKEEKQVLYRALRESGSKYGSSYLQKIQQSLTDPDEIEDMNEIFKIPVMDLRESDYISYKTIVPYLHTLRGLFSITGDQRIIHHIANLAGAWKKDTLTEELNMEKFYLGLKARNVLLQMSDEHDVVRDVVTNYAGILDDQTLTLVRAVQK